MGKIETSIQSIERNLERLTRSNEMLSRAIWAAGGAFVAIQFVLRYFA